MQIWSLIKVNQKIPIDFKRVGMSLVEYRIFACMDFFLNAEIEKEVMHTCTQYTTSELRDTEVSYCMD